MHGAAKYLLHMKLSINFQLYMRVFSFQRIQCRWYGLLHYIARHIYIYIDARYTCHGKCLMFLLIAVGACIQLARLGVKFISVETHASKLTLVVKKKIFSDEQYSIAEV